MFSNVKENTDEFDYIKIKLLVKPKWGKSYKQSLNAARVWEKVFTVLTKDIYLKYEMYYSPNQ